MIQSDIISYFSDQIREISSQIKVAAISKNTEPVHDLRVSIKKIRAIIRVFKLLKKNRKIKGYYRSDIRKIFKKAGILRDLQVQYGLITDYEKILKKEFFDIKEFLSKRIITRHKKFKKVIPDDPIVFFNPLLSEVLSEIEVKTEEKIKKNISSFVDVRLQQFNRTKGRFYAKKLHKQRKILKEIRFTYEMLAKLYTVLDYEEQNLRIKEMEDILGRWNDYNLLKTTIEDHLRQLKKPDTGYVIKMNALSEAVSNDIVILLDSYHKLIPALNIDRGLLSDIF